jgi:hypothetical protein
MISATITVWLLVTTMATVRRLPLRTRLASVSRIGDATKPDYSHAAKRFMRWRRKNWKPRKIKQILVR